MTQKKDHIRYKEKRNPFINSKRRINWIYSLILTVIKWGRSLLFKLEENEPIGLELRLLDLIWKPLLSATSFEDLRLLLGRWKTIRGYMMKLLGASLEERKGLLSNPPQGITPDINKLVKEFLREDMPTLRRRLWMTVMFSTRAIILPENPELDPITQDSKKLTPSYKDYVKGFWKELRFGSCSGVPKGVRWSEWHLTSKQGPNGQALLTLWRDFNSIDQDLKESLMFLGGEKFSSALDTMQRFSPFVEASRIPTQPGRLRKLSSFADAEGKTRIVAILDYFSQSILRPIHSFLFRVLRKIPQDVTFDQGGFRSKISDWEVFYSCDLSSATDRFPIRVISEVLNGIFPTEWCFHWERVMVSKSFSFKGTQEVSYARGNPMGAYSSWASFAVAHHFVMYVACKRASLSWRTAKYVILGDDVLVGDTNLYKEYRQILFELDIPVADAKTHESKTLMEFAKRWVFKGEEITAFPIPAMREAKNYAFLTALLVEERIRGYEVDIPHAIKSWFELKYRSNLKKGKGPRSGFFTDLKIKAGISEQLMYFFRGTTNPTDTFINIHKLVFELERVPAYWDTNRINIFWTMYLRDKWIKSSQVFFKDQADYHDAGTFDPLHEISDILKTKMMDYYPLMGDGFDPIQIPWKDLEDILTCTADDCFFTINQLLRQELSNFNGWEAVKKLVLPSLSTTFRGRKYDVYKVLAGKIASDLLDILRNGRLTELNPDTNSLLLNEKSKREQVFVQYTNPLIGIVSWEGEGL